MEPFLFTHYPCSAKVGSEAPSKLGQRSHYQSSPKIHDNQLLYVTKRMLSLASG
jgi:hypothetical protein